MLRSALGLLLHRSRSLPLLFTHGPRPQTFLQAAAWPTKLFLWASEGNVRHPRAPPSKASRQPAGLPRPLCGLSEACPKLASSLHPRAPPANVSAGRSLAHTASLYSRAATGTTQTPLVTRATLLLKGGRRHPGEALTIRAPATRTFPCRRPSVGNRRLYTLAAPAADPFVGPRGYPVSTPGRPQVESGRRMYMYRPSFLRWMFKNIVFYSVSWVSADTSFV